MRYTLRPNANRQQLAAGNYLVNVTGVDGLIVDTPEFEMKRGQTVTVRVTARSNTDAQNIDSKESGETASVEIEFPGKAIINDLFENSQLTQLPIDERGGESKRIEDGVYRYTVLVNESRKQLSLQIIAHSRRFKSAAFVTRLRSSNGNPFINFSGMNTGSLAHYFSLGTKGGTWNLYFAKQVRENGNWVVPKPTLLKFDNEFNPEMMPGHWIDLAARWSEQDYDLWINGKHVAGGVLPDGFRIDDWTALQFCSTSLGPGKTSLELAFLKVWDQTGLLPEASMPAGLPPRPAEK